MNNARCEIVLQALQQERTARKRLETEIALERADSGSLSSAPSAAPTDTESDADADSPKARNQSRLRRSSRSQRPTGPPRGSPLADYVMQGLSQVCTWVCYRSTMSIQRDQTPHALQNGWIVGWAAAFIKKYCITLSMM